ncbi:hypothetical protein GCM10022210_14490 [Mucilaginibacter dorajii]|uniref:Acyltransferase 3 domain-containing protein n=2 Tax=Mucilaginibacter dorajii TaxID=692994 RepID=A0ABP7PK83_9SPHI
MRMAILFPVLLYFLKLKPAKAFIILFTVSIIAMVVIAFNIEPSFGFLNSFSYTLYYFYIFFVGGLIARYQQALTLFYSSLSPNKKIVSIIGAILLYNYSNFIPSLLVNKHLPAMAIEPVSTMVGDLLTAIASYYLIIAAISTSNNKVLISKIPLFFGKISYSLYLIHLPTLAFIYFTLYGKISTPIILCIGFIVSLLLAAIFNKYVEKPAMGMSKHNLLNNQAEKRL